jgi:hypothetical protein
LVPLRKERYVLRRYLGRSGYVTAPERALRDTAAEPIPRGDRGGIEFPPEPEALDAEALEELATENRRKFQRAKRQDILEQERNAVVRGLDREWQRVGATTGGTVIYGEMRFIRQQALAGLNRGAVLADLNHPVEFCYRLRRRQPPRRHLPHRRLPQNQYLRLSPPLRGTFHN